MGSPEPDFDIAFTDFPRNTVPGGWVEFQDWDCVIYSEDGSTEGTSIKQYYEAVLPIMRQTGVEPGPGPKLEGWFRDAGFEDIHVEKFLMPMGAWPKDKRLVSISSSINAILCY